MKINMNLKKDKENIEKVIVFTFDLAFNIMRPTRRCNVDSS
jgi:hypothetical protein